MLKTNELLKKEGLAYFVNLVREYDTWEWVKTDNQDAKKLAHLFDLYGRDYFIDRYLKFFQEHDDFFFEEKEQFLLEIEQRNIDNYIEDKKQYVIPITLLNQKAGLVFATKYRSELGNALARHFESIYDFIVIINIEHGISYRGIKDVDLNKVANVFGGKGHINSSGSPLPDNIQETMAKLIFGDKISIEHSNTIN
jgi:oligoribonuclease NrnB/cAMP/cGMP phosphodiesterase (DHH superfamily)